MRSKYGRLSLQPKYQPLHRICRGDHNVFGENLRLAKGSSAGVQRTPLRVCARLIFLVVGEDIILTCMTIPPSFSCENATSLYTREAFFWFSFYYFVSSFLIVGDDILGVPFIKISLHFARTCLPLQPKYRIAHENR